MELSTYGAASDPGGEDGGARSENVNKRAIVGVVGCKDVAGGNGANGADGGLGGRGEARRLSLGVSCGNGKEDAGLDHGGGAGVDGIGLASSQAHAGEHALGAVARLGVLDSKVHARDDLGVGPGAFVVEHLDTVNGRLLGSAVRLAANGAGAVGAVAVAVGGLAGDEGFDL